MGFRKSPRCKRNTEIPYYSILKNNPLEFWKKNGSGSFVNFINDSKTNIKGIKLDGVVTASNSITLGADSLKSLKLTGNFLYLILIPIEDKGFLINIDCKTASSVEFRISLSNIYEKLKSSNLSLHLPIKIPYPHRKWLILRLNITCLVSNYSKYRHKFISGIQLCSSLIFVGALTSDYEYSYCISDDEKSRKTSNTFLFPKEFAFLNSVNNKQVNVNMLRFPEDLIYSELKETPQHEYSCSSSSFMILDGMCKDSTNNEIDNGSKENYLNKFSSIERNKEIKNSSMNGQSVTLSDIANKTKGLISPDFHLNSLQTNSSELQQLKKKNMDELSIIFPYTNQLSSLELLHISACPTFCSNLLILQKGQLIVFSCFNYVILMNIENKQQCLLTGHTSEVSGICGDSDSKLLASCQSPTFEFNDFYTSLVHVWELPDINYLKKQNHYPLGTGRARNVKLLKGLCFTNRAEFLISYGLDSHLRGLVVIWDLRYVTVSNVLPVVARSTIESSITCLQLFPKSLYKIDDEDSVIRFVTISGNSSNLICNTKNLKLSNSNSIQLSKTINHNQIRLWRFRFTSIISSQSPDLKKLSNNKFHLNSSPLPLISTLTPGLRHELDFISCCFKPQITTNSYSADELHKSINKIWCDQFDHTLLVASRTGYLIEVDVNLFTITNVYQMIQKTDDLQCRDKILLNEEHSENVQIHLIASRQIVDNESVLKYTTNNFSILKNDFNKVNSICWIPYDTNQLNGWLGVTTFDGYLRLWNVLNMVSASSLLLEVRYPGRITALDSCLSIEDVYHYKENYDNFQRYVHIVISTEKGGLACLDIHLGQNETNDMCESINANLKLLECKPKRLLSWQVNSPILCMSIIKGNEDGTESIIGTLTMNGSIRIWKTSSNLSRRNSNQLHNLNLIETPLYDLMVPGETPTHMILQPIKNWLDGSKQNSNNFINLYIACGYPKSGLIRIFSLSTVELVVQLDLHKNYDISTLSYSPCSKYMYSADSSGQLTLWNISFNFSSHNLPKFNLVRSISHQISVFKLFNSSINKSILEVCPNTNYIIYVGPNPSTITVGNATNLETFKEIHLNQLIIEYFPQSYEDMKSVILDQQYPHFLTFFNDDQQVNDYYSTNERITNQIFVGTSNGYFFHLNILNENVLGFGKFPLLNRINSSDNNESINFVTTMKLSPDGQNVLITVNKNPFIYMFSTKLNEPTVSKSTKSEIIPSSKFIGHYYPIHSLDFTCDGNYCITIDVNINYNDDYHNQWNQTYTRGSSILVWKYRNVNSTENNQKKSVDLKSLPETNPSPNLNDYEIDLEETKDSNSVPTTPPPSQSSPKLIEIPKLVFSDQNENQSQLDVSYKGDRYESIQSNQLIKFHKPLSLRHWPTYFSYTNSNNTKSHLFAQERVESFMQNLNLLPINKVDENEFLSFIGFGNSDQFCIENFIWDPDTGLFVYIHDSTLILEDLERNIQSVYQSKFKNNNLSYEFCGELLSSIILAPNKNCLAIGSISYWSENADSCTKSSAVSSFIIVPIKHNQQKDYQVPRNLLNENLPLYLDYTNEKRLCFPFDNYTDTVTSDNEYSLFKNELNSFLLTMSFTINSRYLITISDYRSNLIGVWCTKLWNCLNCIHFDNGFINQIVCSPLNWEEFITIGMNFIKIDENNWTKQSCLKFWKLDYNFTITSTTKKFLTYSQPDLSKNKFPIHLNIDWNLELSAATYVIIPLKNYSHLLTNYSYSSERLLQFVIVSNQSGNLFIWDTKNMLCLKCWSADSDEICLLSPCGPLCFVSGTKTGSIKLWRVELNYENFEQVYYDFSQTRLNQINLENIIECKLIKSIHSFDSFNFDSINGGIFDPEGIMGVIGTGGSKIWYVNWSEIEPLANHSDDQILQTSQSSSMLGLTALITGHRKQITGLAWWFNNDANVNQTSFHGIPEGAEYNNQLILVTCSLDGAVCLWDPSNRQLICQLQLNNYVNTHPNPVGAVCLDVLNFYDLKCSGSYNNSVEYDKVSGCLIVAYEDMSLKLFCLHKFCLVKECAPICSKVKSSEITAVRFYGPQHVIVATREGLLVLMSVSHENNVGKSSIITYQTDYSDLYNNFSVERIMYDHFNKNDQTNNIQIRCLDIFKKSIKWEDDCEKYSIRKKYPTLGKNEKNCTKKAQDHEVDFGHKSWICLAVGLDNRLSIWHLLINSNINSVEKSTTRFHLIYWLMLETISPCEQNLSTFQLFNSNSSSRIEYFENNGHSHNLHGNGKDNNENIEQEEQRIFHAKFFPPENWLEFLPNQDKFNKIRSQKNVPIILIFESNIKKYTKFWFCYLKNNSNKKSLNPIPWFTLDEYVINTLIHNSDHMNYLNLILLSIRREIQIKIIRIQKFQRNSDYLKPYNSLYESFISNQIIIPSTLHLSPNFYSSTALSSSSSLNSPLLLRLLSKQNYLIDTISVFVGNDPLSNMSYIANANNTQLIIWNK